MDKQNELPLVSVVMLSFNRAADVREGVGEILSLQYTNIEIIVVDNGSSDGTAEMVRTEFSDQRVKLTALDENIGIAAYNIGFDRTQGEYIVILDDDSFPERNAIPRMVEEFQNDPELGIVAFDVRNYYDYRETNRTIETKPNQDDNAESRYQMAFNGAGVGVRKECMEKVGGYPEEFFLYWNEQDLSIRVLDAGYRIRWFTDIISLHKYSPANRDSRRAPFYYTRNLYWLIWKYFPPGKMLKDTFQLIYYSFYHSFSQNTLVYLKATVAALAHIGKIKRRPVKKAIIKALRLTYRLPFIYYR